MTYPRFRQIAAESPGLIFELATQLATRLDRTNRKLGDLAFVDVTGRVAHAIMDLCGEPDAMTHPEGMQIKVSRQELSRLVGCSREMAGRVLKVLEEQGLLRATGKTIVVFNARPKVKTRPLIVPVKGGTASNAATSKTARIESMDDDDDDDEDEDDDDRRRRRATDDGHDDDKSPPGAEANYILFVNTDISINPDAGARFIGVHCDPSGRPTPSICARMSEWSCA
jgi:hypothetical protein